MLNITVTTSGTYTSMYSFAGGPVGTHTSKCSLHLTPAEHISPEHRGLKLPEELSEHSLIFLRFKFLEF